MPHLAFIFSSLKHKHTHTHKLIRRNQHTTCMHMIKLWLSHELQDNEHQKQTTNYSLHSEDVRQPWAASLSRKRHFYYINIQLILMFLLFYLTIYSSQLVRLLFYALRILILRLKQWQRTFFNIPFHTPGHPWTLTFHTDGVLSQ